MRKEILVAWSRTVFTTRVRVALVAQSIFATMFLSTVTDSWPDFLRAAVGLLGVLWLQEIIGDPRPIEAFYEQIADEPREKEGPGA